MSGIILCGRDGRPSMKGVFRLMVMGVMAHRRRLPSRTYWRFYTHDREDFVKKSDFAPQSGDVVIRWGNRIEFNTEGFISYNNCNAIERATNKKKSREIFLEKGVRCPRLITPQNYDSINPSKVIARPLSHSKGKNFIVLESKQAFINHYKNGWYYSEFIDKEREFRAHIALGKCLGVLEKPKPTNGEIAWNRAVNHESFELMEWSKVKKDVMYQACLAAEALGLSFCGVDVIFKDNMAYVVEANTASTLNSSPHITQKYAKFFDFLFRNTTTEKLKPWNFRKWEKRVSFFWKDYQLEASGFGLDVNNIVSNENN